MASIVSLYLYSSQSANFCSSRCLGLADLRILPLIDAIALAAYIRLGVGQPLPAYPTDTRIHSTSEAFK